MKAGLNNAEMKRDPLLSIDVTSYYLFRSIRKSIKYGYAKDQKRAEQILNVELDNQDSDQDEQQQQDYNQYLYSNNNNLYSPSKMLSERKIQEIKKQGIKKGEMAFEDNLIQLRSDYYLALDEKKMGFTKKKLFTKNNIEILLNNRISFVEGTFNYSVAEGTNNTRCLQSKINLKFPIKEMLNDKPKPQYQIKQGVLEEFEKNYKEMCNQQYQRVKNRNVSPESPFGKNNFNTSDINNANNIHLPSNPTKINPKEIDISKVPLAGRLSEIGAQLLSLQGKKVGKNIVTLNWGVGYPDSNDKSGEKHADDNDETNNQTYGKFLHEIKEKQVGQRNLRERYQILPRIENPNYIMSQDRKRNNFQYFSNQQSTKNLYFTSNNSPQHFQSTDKVPDYESPRRINPLDNPNNQSFKGLSKEDFLNQAKEQRKLKFLERVLSKRQSLNKSVISRQQEIEFNSHQLYNTGKTQRLENEDVVKKRMILEQVLGRSNHGNFNQRINKVNTNNISNYQ